MLRHTTPTAVTVWVALKAACRVQLTILETADQGQSVGQTLWQAERDTVAIGQNLHVVAVTATGKTLSADQLYAYDLTFLAMTEAAIDCPLSAALHPPQGTAALISYFDHQLPTFALPPSDLQDLKLVHGSCRKLHGKGQDTLVVLDHLIQNAAHHPQKRPHQLFLTGDQIYGDDVADALLWAATQIGDRLLGWVEVLPVAENMRVDPTAVPLDQLLPGQRSLIATRDAGLTAGLKRKYSKVTSHFFGLSEFCGAYLLAWSPTCWPQSFPTHPPQRNSRKSTRQWRQDLRQIHQLLQTLGRVRRALANIPVYTIFDDHDVSDDWFLNQAWCLRVLSKPLGQRVIQNALLSYAIFQGWGNTPERFAPGTPGETLLRSAARWSDSKGGDRQIEQQLRQLLGLPPTDPKTGLPQFCTEGEMQVLDRSPTALRWHYTVHGPRHDVVVLDTRTQRGYPAAEQPIAPPMLLSPRAFENQLSQPLQNIAARPDSASERVCIVVAPTNLFGLQAIDWIQHWDLNRDRVYENDVGDAWNLRLSALAKLLCTLFAQHQHILVLSGDIHYGASIHLDYRNWQATEGWQNRVVQFTSSAIKNEELLTRLIHTRLKQWLFPEPTRYWAGWNHPTDMESVPALNPKQFPADRSPPDWVCALHWTQRQRAQPLPGDWTKNQKLRSPSLFSSCQRWFPWNWPWFQEGNEVVGKNNISLVQFQPQGPELVVTQDLFWFQKLPKKRVVSSRFTETLPTTDSKPQQ